MTSLKSEGQDRLGSIQTHSQEPPKIHMYKKINLSKLIKVNIKERTLCIFQYMSDASVACINALLNCMHIKRLVKNKLENTCFTDN